MISMLGILIIGLRGLVLCIIIDLSNTIKIRKGHKAVIFRAKTLLAVFKIRCEIKRYKNTQLEVALQWHEVEGVVDTDLLRITIIEIVKDSRSLKILILGHILTEANITISNHLPIMIIMIKRHHVVVDEEDIEVEV